MKWLRASDFLTLLLGLSQECSVFCLFIYFFLLYFFLPSFFFKFMVIHYGDEMSGMYPFL